MSVPATAGGAPAGWPQPDRPATAQSTRLARLIGLTMDEAGGAITFERYMELALYTPGLGYYSAGARKFGQAGDFVTAPEISPLFGRCLARQCRQVLEALGGGRVLEFGAGSGVMAADVLLELEALDALPERYMILEVSAELAARQRETLARRAGRLAARVEWLERLPEDGFRGIILANEVLDAMPVRRFRVTENGLRELGVARERDGFRWVELPADEAVAAAVEDLERDLGRRFPCGFESEINPRLGPWMTSTADVLEAGVVLVIDYGYPRREYYHPERDGGTLMCHYRHRVHADPLILPGLQDITAHVDFTALAQAAVDAGLELIGYTTQACFLIGCGLVELVAGMENDDTRERLETARQMKILTLPGEMGERFKVLAAGRGMGDALAGFGFQDHRARL